MGNLLELITPLLMMLVELMSGVFKAEETLSPPVGALIVVRPIEDMKELV